MSVLAGVSAARKIVQGQLDPAAAVVNDQLVAAGIVLPTRSVARTAAVTATPAGRSEVGLNVADRPSAATVT